MSKLLFRRLSFALVALLSILYLAALGLQMARGLSFPDALPRAATATALYIGHLLQGDLGLSTSRGRLPIPAGPVIARTVAKSSLLLAVSLVGATVLGVLLAGAAARRRHAPWSLPILLTSLAGISTPSFLLALALQVLALRFYQNTGIRLFSLGGFTWSSLWLPALVLMARPFAQITRMTFFAISEALEEDYARTALSKGVDRRDLLRRHIYRNVAIPVLTAMVTSLRFSLVSLPVVEYFFSWPGAGEALLRGIRRQDDALVYGLLLLLGALFILMNILLEGLYRLVDPRLRRPESGVQLAHSLHPGFRETWSELWRTFLDSAPLAWLRGLFRPRQARESPFARLVGDRAAERGGGEGIGELHRRERRRAWFRAILLNPPLLLGGVGLVLLLGIVLLGPLLAPHNPYNTTGFRFIEGKMQTPPFAPDKEYPWGSDALGRDMLSLVLVGAQQTLVLATVVVLARVLLGGLLGLLAGWFEGTWFDRLVMTLVEIIAAFPALLCAMVLILALGIRRGMISFVVGLCFVGWGEVAQFVRAQVVALRPRLFVEAAVVMGSRWPEILSRHILPNLLTPLVGLAALEVGAVLMLLGELGFVGIFIGGGAFAELVIFGPPYYYSDVPEWAALLANIRGYARAYPWMAWPPVLAFALSIVAFNLTGEGVLRLIERVGVSFTRLLNRYTALAAAAFALVILLVRMQTGPLAFYRPLARSFDGEKALAHVQVLAGELGERSLGSDALDQAADYVAAQFELAGLRPAGQLGSYFLEVEREYIALTAPPTLSLAEDLPAWTWQRDFAVPFDLPYRVDGRGRGEVVLVGLGTLSEPDLSGCELGGKVVLVPDLATLHALRQSWPARKGPILGALVVEEERPFETYALGTTSSPAGRPTYPLLLIRPEVAEALLKDSGLTLEGLRRQVARLGEQGTLCRPLGKTASLQVPGEPRRVTVRYVLGYLPGGVGTGGAAGQQREAAQKMDDQILILMAPYDAPGLAPDGTLYPAAGDAAGVATLIELARSWQEADYRPKRAVLFAAYVGQGADPNHSYRRQPDPQEFLHAATGFSEYKIWAVLKLSGLGYSQGRHLLVDSESTRLGALLVRAARRMDVPVRRVERVLDLEAIQEGGTFSLWGDMRGEPFSWAEGHWDASTAPQGTPADRPDALSASSLEQAGRSLSLALMVLGREWNY